ncbi:MAG: response regulator [Desulfobacterales bacterium]|jgi:two-component system chemotaxis response regulator CheY
MRVLVIDDDKPTRQLLKEMVSKIGACETADSGKKAIAAFVEAWQDWRPFDLILLDILMPEMNGSQVLSKIRELEKEKQVPEKLKVKIVMVSGVSEKETVMACLRDGCDDFLVKPLESQSLLKKIRNFRLQPTDR